MWLFILPLSLIQPILNPRHTLSGEKKPPPIAKMTSIRPFQAMDVFNFNTTNLDPLTETYGLDFYFTYLARWPHLFNVAESHTGEIDGYSTSS